MSSPMKRGGRPRWRLALSRGCVVVEWARLPTGAWAQGLAPPNVLACTVQGCPPPCLCCLLVEVDGLVAYFNQLHGEDWATIESLEGQVAHQAQIIAAMSSGAQQQQQQQQEQRQDAGSSVKAQDAAAPLLRSAHPRSPGAPVFSADPPGGARGAGPRTRLVGAVAAAVVLALVAGLGAGLGLRGQARRAAPQFVYAPLVVGSTSGSIDVQLALGKEGVVHYVLVPTAQPTDGLDGASVVAASAGMLRGSALEVSPPAFSSNGLRCCLHCSPLHGRLLAPDPPPLAHSLCHFRRTRASIHKQGAAVACGQLPVATPGANRTLSIVGHASTPECLQQSAVGPALSVSCSRCPTLLAATSYTVLLTPASTSAIPGGVARLQVRGPQSHQHGAHADVPTLAAMF